MGLPVRLIPWCVFVGACLAAACFNAVGWRFTWFGSGQIGLAVITVGCAVWAVVSTRRKMPAFSVAAVGLVAANWLLLETVAMVSIWSINGFAP